MQLYNIIRVYKITNSIYICFVTIRETSFAPMKNKQKNRVLCKLDDDIAMAFMMPIFKEL